ncbi:MarR family winged helix-turn-helix transcriptional regulator [Sulfurospirillum arcachonense]|uniref:MarR family winged helix-turn-helix transcriptional regulator n=1 Tax=Sulfurospirillum arcachonense TaxID=57666 RepID=UPI00046A0602|nr:MarR family transcriptional regulator [Sulfurospirillum arcachonense]
MKKNVKSYGVRTDKSMQTWMQLSRAFYKISTKEIHYFAQNDLTLNQFKVLEVLYHRGNLNIGSITKLTMSTPGNITVVVRNLKRDGWIYTVKDENDKRSTLLSISPKGTEVIDRIFPTHSKNLTSNFKILNDEELNTLYILLRKLHKSQ